jgi:arginine decarboxylase
MATISCKDDSLRRWSINDSADLYHIREWGAGYFDISVKGNIAVKPIREDPSISIDLMDVVSGIVDRGHEMPLLLRIENILESQIASLHDSFSSAIKQCNYKGDYRGVYPIKVNQQRQVIAAITHTGALYHHGLEAGSKAELIAALSFLRDKKACLICNGYKDREFVNLGLYALKMGYRCFFVIEMLSELDLILECSRELNIRPNIGIRFKLSTRAGGHWTESGGDRSIFGLNTTQIIQVADRLREHGMLDCLKLLHYHLGSQIPNIRDIRSAVQEACRVYVGLVHEGACMGYLDIGGGLAVDYDGSHTNFTNSRNYTLDEYCVDVVEAVMETLEADGVAHPTIITESGRATVAYYSVLLFNILDVNPIVTPFKLERLPEESPDVLCNIREVFNSLNLKNLQEGFNDALYYRDQVRQLFNHGELSLRERSLGEKIFWAIMARINENLKQLKYVPSELQALKVALSDIYYANFSVFQSLPDAWAIGHLFPIMPIHRLEEMPTRHAILADITCDCDGKIDRFIDLHGVRKTLPLHKLKHNEEYYLGVFLVGAYQETLGDLHNLLGDTNVVSIRVAEDGQFTFVRELEGDTVGDVLSYVQYSPKAMTERFRATAEQAVREKKITPPERRQITKAYEAGMLGYTYFER